LVGTAHFRTRNFCNVRVSSLKHGTENPQLPNEHPRGNQKWVFEHHKDLSDFINSGWELGGQTSAAAKLDDEGGAFAGAMSISPGIWLYQLTDDGLALELTGKGTKYYKDDDLN